VFFFFLLLCYILFISPFFFIPQGSALLFLFLMWLRRSACRKSFFPVSSHYRSLSFLLRKDTSFSFSAISLLSLHITLRPHPRYASMPLLFPRHHGTSTLLFSSASGVTRLSKSRFLFFPSPASRFFPPPLFLRCRRILPAEREGPRWHPMELSAPSWFGCKSVPFSSFPTSARLLFRKQYASRPSLLTSWCFQFTVFSSPPFSPFPRAVLAISPFF